MTLRVRQSWTVRQLHINARVVGAKRNPLVLRAESRRKADRGTCFSHISGSPLTMDGGPQSQTSGFQQGVPLGGRNLVFAETRVTAEMSQSVLASERPGGCDFYSLPTLGIPAGIEGALG